MTRTLLSLSLLLSLAGCAEARNDRDTGGGTDTPAASDTPVATDAPSVGTDTPAPPTDAPAGTNQVVINEINPSSPDWVELINTGTSALSLDGLSIIDADDAHTAVPFPAGTSLAPGQRYIVAFDAICADPAPTGLGLTARCLETTYGIGGAGDTIRIQDADGNDVVSVVFPGETAAGLGADQTYCRLPDGSGAFAACAATLDAVNAAP
jgi:hypothetical protein